LPRFFSSAVAQLVRYMSVSASFSVFASQPSSSQAVWPTPQESGCSHFLRPMSRAHFCLGLFSGSGWVSWVGSWVGSCSFPFLWVGQIGKKVICRKSQRLRKTEGSPLSSVSSLRTDHGAFPRRGRWVAPTLLLPFSHPLFYLYFSFLPHSPAHRRRSSRFEERLSQKCTIVR
jgi:hypothetical protein